MDKKKDKEKKETRTVIRENMTNDELLEALGIDSDVFKDFSAQLAELEKKRKEK